MCRIGNDVQDEILVKMALLLLVRLRVWVSVNHGGINITGESEKPRPPFISMAHDSA